MQHIVLFMSLGLLLAACGPLNQFMGNQTAPPTPVVTPPLPHPTPNATPANTTPTPVVTPPAPPVPPNNTPPAPHNTVTDQQVWNWINTDNEQKECLAIAKQSTGSYSSITTCVCDESLGQNLKTYTCTAMQGSVPVRIDCRVTKRSCDWVSGANSGSITFDQIAQSMAQGG